MRCPQCNKFVALSSETEPEAELECDDNSVSGTVRIVLTCEECGEEMKQAEFDVQEDVNLTDDRHCGDRSVEVDSVEMTERTFTDPKTKKKTTMFGFELSGHLECSCGADIGSFNAEEEIDTNEMEELV